MNDWSGRRVLVTGGAGFIGSALVERLVGLGAAVRVVDNLERGRRENLRSVEGAIEFRREDLRVAEVCERACRDMEVVFHLASKVGGIRYYLTRPAEVLAQNSAMDSFMLQAAAAAGVEGYLYASSAHVYPIELQMSPGSPLITEAQAIPAHPELSYGWAKLLGEKHIEYCVAEGTSLCLAVVRLIGVYGPRQDLDLATGSVIPVLIRRAIEYPERKPFVVLGTGEETRSFSYIDDIVDGLLRIVGALNRYPIVGPLNLGREDRVTIGDLAAEIVRISGKDIQIDLDRSHPTVIWGQALDCSRVRDLLDGWYPQVSLHDGLERTYAYIEAQLRGS
jgi:nucleoside-diphosphate-sugar epimerase